MFLTLSNISVNPHLCFAEKLGLFSREDLHDSASALSLLKTRVQVGIGLESKTPAALIGRLYVAVLLDEMFEALILCSCQEKLDVSGQSVVAHLNICNNNTGTALHIAALNGDDDAVSALIAFKADVSIANQDNKTPIQVAQGGCAKLIARMEPPTAKEEDDSSAQSGEQAENEIDNGWTSLMFAAELGLVDQIKVLLDAGDHILSRNGRQQSALHIAAQAGHASVIRQLVHAKGELEARDSKQHTALCSAARNGKVEAVRALIQAKANHAVLCESEDSTVKSLLELANGDDVIGVLKSIGADGWTPLMVAVEKGVYQVRKYLQAMECAIKMKARDKFRDWMQGDFAYYVGLEPVESHWTWGLHEEHNLTISSDGLTVTKKSDSPDYSCVVGSEIFVDGVHRWTVQVRNVQAMWIGVARGVEGQDLLGSLPHKKPCEDGCILAFGLSYMDVRMYGDKDPSISYFSHDGYSSGSKIEFELDMHELSLKMWVNGALSLVASDLDAAEGKGLCPFACMDYNESILLLTRSSFVNKGSTLDLSDDLLQCFDNIKWPTRLDDYLFRLASDLSFEKKNVLGHHHTFGGTEYFRHLPKLVDCTIQFMYTDSCILIFDFQGLS